MPSPILIHRDTMLGQTGYMPARKAGETDKEWQARLATAASEAEKELGLQAYYVKGKRARRYRQDDIDKVVPQIVSAA